MPQQAPDADQKCILVVDDDEVIRNFVSGLLTRDGYDVVVAGTGDEALRLSKDHQEQSICFSQTFRCQE